MSSEVIQPLGPLPSGDTIVGAASTSAIHSRHNGHKPPDPKSKGTKKTSPPPPEAAEADDEAPAGHSSDGEDHAIDVCL